MARILIVDDDLIFSTPFASYLSKLGHQCNVAETLSDGLRMAADNRYDIVFLDVILPDRSGLEGIGEFKSADSSPEIVIVTGKGDSSGAEIALRNGAWDYLEKPPSYVDIKLIINRALRYRDNKRLADWQDKLNRDFIIGKDINLRDCLETVAKAAKSDGNVLISGETGTGKELIAKAVHINSRRAIGNFVTVDCTNLPENLVENILFGHVKGTFTGADKDKDGLVNQADGGTLFLDEIADLPLSAQKSLLGTLQNKRFRPLGAKTEKACDFRVISATNKDLLAMQAEESFRKDLYYRLMAYHIHLPPLRDRLEDIKLLTEHYNAKICQEFGLNTKSVSDDFIETLLDYEWPGNVRELINVLHTTIANAINEPMIYPHHLPVDMRIHLRKSSLKREPGTTAGLMPVMPESDSHMLPSLKVFRKMIESKYLDELIKVSDSNAKKACRIANVSRSGLYRLLERHGKRIKP